MILVAVTPGRGGSYGAAFGAAVEAALAAGVDRLVVREAILPDVVLDLVAAYGDRVVLHARMPGAAAVAASLGIGLHLPGGASVVEARRGFRGVLGYSAHTPDEARRARAEGADYVFLSPIWAAGSKPGDTRRPLGVEALRGADAVALGGVTPERVEECARAGAAGVAALGGIFGEGFDAVSVSAAVARYRAAQKLQMSSS